MRRATKKKGTFGEETTAISGHCQLKAGRYQLKTPRARPRMRGPCSHEAEVYILLGSQLSPLRHRSSCEHNLPRSPDRLTPWVFARGGQPMPVELYRDITGLAHIRPEGRHLHAPPDAVTAGQHLTIFDVYILYHLTNA